MKRLCIFASIALVLCGCTTNKKVVEKEGKGTYTNDAGEITTAKVELKDDKIDDVDLDETVKGKDQTKKELKEDYNMKKASTIQKEWYQQVEFLENYIEKNGVDKIKMNAEGKAENDDVKSGCTIAVDGFVKAVKEGIKNAK